MRGVTIEKKPSVDCSALPVPTPSIVMLTVLLGRPLISALRGPPVVETPGSMLTEYNALRDTIGNSLSCSTEMLVVTAVDCVCTSSAPALTSMVSLNWPISSRAVISPARAASRRTSVATKVLNPVSDTVTV